MLDVLYKDFVRRWTLVDGFPQCIEDAVPSYSTVAMSALQRNAAIQAALTAVEAFEADPESEVSDATRALALWRTPRPEDGLDERPTWDAARATVEAAIDTAAAIPLSEDPRPLPQSVSVRQFAQAAAQLDLITPDEALAWAKREALPAIMEQMLTAIPDQYRWEGRIMLEGASAFEPGNEFVTMFSVVANVPDDVQGQLWRLAASL